MEALLGTILWRPEVGDPTLVGWVTTIGYGIAAALCVDPWIELNNKEAKERSKAALDEGGTIFRFSNSGGAAVVFLCGGAAGIGFE